ncbi:Fc receptor-like protein 5 [Eleutherodactylus coqui]|uniref:Fc receptor-like protein 5 n=1 Tax=Eleutherodactylus coqui TaxID=57060 RepID=UPI0034638108
MTCYGGSTTGGGLNYIWYKDNSTVHNGKSYTIQSAEILHSGSYRCQTRPGEISDPAGLDVSDGRVILQTPLYVYEGDEINIRCHHRPRYPGGPTRFYKDNRVIRDWTDTAEYYIGNVDGTTAGTYRCEKQISGPYIYGDEVSVSVEGAAIRPAVTFSPNYKKIFTTESITMSCDGGSTIGGGSNYIWYKDYSPVHNGKSYTIQSAGTSDSGSYRCQTRPGEISDPARLDVSDGWVILQTPLYVYEGDKINIRCHHRPGYSGGPTRFYKDNRFIADWTDNAEYYIGHVDRTTAGTYGCEKDISGQNIHYDVASVSVEELFMIPTINMTPNLIFANDNLSLSCETRLPPARQNRQLRSAFYREGRIVQDFSINDIYKVYNVQLEHSGKYSCAVETTDGRVRKRSAERLLQIEEPFSHPNITVTSEFYEGDPMILTCDSTLSPHIYHTGLQFAFYRDGREVQGFNLSNKYEVQSVQQKDSGNYTCEVKISSNTAVRRSYGIYIHIQELSAPKLKVFPELVNEGDNMTLTCETNLTKHKQNATKLRYAFYRNDVKIQGFNSSNKYEVQFNQEKNVGTYTCEIQTSTGRVKKRSQELPIEGQNDSSLTTILLVSLGLLLIIVIISIVLCIYYQRRSSNNNPQPPTDADHDYSPEGEVSYAVLAMSSRPQSQLPKDNESNVVYAKVKKSKANGQVKSSQGTSDTSTDIYQNISSNR